MLNSFFVDNFKSLINLTFEPAGLNLLIGNNNAGKTNICHSLRFLSLTAQMDLYNAAENCTAEPWNLLNVYVKNKSLSFAVTCELPFENEILTFNYKLKLESHKALRLTNALIFTVESEELRVTGGKFEDVPLLLNDRGRVRLLHEERYKKGMSHGVELNYVDTKAPIETTMLFRLYDLETNPRANLFKRYLSSWGYYSLDPTSLRCKQARPSDAVLDSKGMNLSSVMYTLHNVNPRIERKIIEAARELEPRLDLLSFQSPDPEHVYMYFEDGKGNKFGVDNISDGTLRHLAICYLVITSRENHRNRPGTPLIIVEEPENGIFVRYLKSLFQRIEPSGKEGQFIFTSHSPYFIDLFDASLDGLFVVKAIDNHSSLFKPDGSTLVDKLGKFSLGEMHFQGLIG